MLSPAKAIDKNSSAILLKQRSSLSSFCPWGGPRGIDTSLEAVILRNSQGSVESAELGEMEPRSGTLGRRAVGRCAAETGAGLWQPQGCRWASFEQASS